MASWRASARPGVPSRSTSSSWMWFQAIAIAPVAAGAATGTTWPMPSGRSSATSRAIIPPNEPPVTRAKRPMPRASASRHSARASSRAEMAGKDGPRGTVAGSMEVGPVDP